MAIMVARNMPWQALVSHGVPTALIAALTLALLGIPDVFQVLLPVVAFASGLILRPRRVWVIWIASLVIVVVSTDALLLLGFRLPKAADQGSVTALGLLVNVALYALYLVVLAVLPLWLGRSVGKRRGHRQGP